MIQVTEPITTDLRKLKKAVENFEGLYPDMMTEFGFDLSSDESFNNSVNNNLKDKDSQFKFYQYLKEKDLLGDDVADPNTGFNLFRNKYFTGVGGYAPYSSDTEKVGKVEGASSSITDLAPEKKDNTLAFTVSQSGYSSSELYSKRKKKLDEDLNNSLTKVKAQYTDKDGNLDKNNSKYQGAIKTLKKAYEADLERITNLQNEESLVQEANIVNPLIPVTRVNKQGKEEKINIGAHSWAFNEPGLEEDTKSGDYFFQAEDVDLDDETIPFLKRQYPDYKFESSYIGGTGATFLEVTSPNNKFLRIPWDRIDGNDNKKLQKAKVDLIDFINTNGFDLDAASESRSEGRNQYAKILNTPFDKANPAEGGIALNDYEKTYLAENFGGYQEVQTKLGPMSKFIANPKVGGKSSRIEFIEKVNAMFASNPNWLFPQSVIDNPYSEEADNAVTEFYLTQIDLSPDGTWANSPAGRLNVVTEEVADRATIPLQSETDAEGTGEWWGPGSEIYNKSKIELETARQRAGQPAPTREEILNYTANVRYEETKSQMLEEHWDAYLTKVGNKKKAEILGFNIESKDINIQKSAELQKLIHIEVEEFTNTQNSMLIDYFEKIYKGVEEFPKPDPGEAAFKLENGKIVSESLWNDYSNAVASADVHYKRLLKQRQKVWDLQDESGDLDAAWDLLRRDYSVWNKFWVDLSLGFSDIVMGGLYYAGKVGGKVQEVGNSVFKWGLEAVTPEQFEDNLSPLFDLMDLSERTNNKIIEGVGSEYVELKNEIKDNYAKDVQFHATKWGGKGAFGGDFGTFLAQEVSRQIPIITTLVATGGTAGPVILGAYTAGDYWMGRDYTESYKGKLRSDWIDLAAATGYGLAEAVFERITTVPILKRGNSLINRMGKEQMLKKGQAMKAFFKQEAGFIPLSTVSESVAEGLTQITQNLIDGRPIVENVDHAMFVGGMFGFGMSASPFIMGMAAAGFTGNNKLKDSRALANNTRELEQKYLELKANGAEASILEYYETRIKEQRQDYKDQVSAKISNIENTLGGGAFSSYVKATMQIEAMKDQAQTILGSNINEAEKQKQLESLKKSFDDQLFVRDVWNDGNAFGNDFSLLKSTDKKAYDSYMQQARTEFLKNKDVSDDAQVDIKKVKARATELYIQDQVNTNYEKVSNINKQFGLNIKLDKVQTKEEAYKKLDQIREEMKADLESKGQLTEANAKNVDKVIAEAKAGVKRGNNGANINSFTRANEELTSDYSLVVVDNAVSNEKTQVSTHEIGHAVFTKLLGRNAEDFVPMKNAIIDYLQKVKGGDAVLKRILMLDAQAMDDTKADEFIMGFLEQVGQDRVPMNNKMGSLFAKAAKDGVSTSTNGELQFDFKGADDAVSFLIGMGKAIASGQVTMETIEAAKQSKVIEETKKAAQARDREKAKREAIIDRVTSKASANIMETAEEKAGRRKNREEKILDIYRDHALDEDGAPLSKAEWQNFLDTREGQLVTGELLELYDKDLLAIGRGNRDAVAAAIRPLILHIRSFNPQTSNDLAGWIGARLKQKLGTGLKTLTKGQAPVGTKRIGEQREGTRALDIADTSSEINLDEQRKSFREGIGVETNSKLYNTVVKAGERVIGGRLPKFEFTYKSGKRKGQTVKLSDVKSRLKENPNDAQAITDLNNIYKNVRQELASNYDSFLFTEIKKSMGTGDAYKSYLKGIRPTIMKDMSIADLVAMERLAKQKTLTKLEASNLNPTQIRQYEGTGDLVYTNPNAGPNLYSRLNPTEEEFIEFFEKRGRKDALAKNIAKQFGFDVTMQSMNDNIVDVIDKAFPTENLNNIAKDEAAKEMLQNFAAAIGTGVNTRFSGALNENINEELLSGLESMVGVNGISNDVKERKPQIRAVVEGVYPNLPKKAITEIVNDLNRILAPYGRLINKYQAIDVNVEEFINDVLTNNETQSISDFYGVGSVTDLFRTKIDSQRNFVKLLANDMKKNYINPLELAAEFWHYKAGLEDGSNNPSRLMTFFNEGSGGHTQAYIDQFIAPVFSTKENPITGVKTRTVTEPMFGYPVEQVVFTYKDESTAIVNSQRRVTQGTTKEMVNNTMSEVELNRRKKDADRAFNFVVNVYKAADNLVTNNIGNNENLAMLSAGFGANMKGPIRSAARLRYLPINPPTTQLKKNGKKQFEYEHGIPAVVVNLAIADYVYNKNSDVDLKKLQENYTVGIIHVDFNDNFGTLFQSTMPFGYKIGDSPITRWINKYTIGGPMHGLFDLDTKKEVKEVADAVKLSKQMIAANNVNKKVLSNNVVTMKASDNLAEVVGYAATVDNALNVARNPNAPVKKIRVFDFDDTLATSNNIVFAKKGDETLELNAEEFAAEGERLLSEGYTFDFTDFNTVRDGGRGPLFKVAEKIRDARGTEDVFVLTARAPEAQVPIHEFLKSQGLNIPLANITGLGNSTGAAKAQWIIDKAAEGYNDFYFADDAIGNVNAVKDALAQIDVKSQVQQAKVRFSENVDEDFNNIIEQTTGVKSFKEYSAAKAKTTGAHKGKFKFWIPYGAEDFVGLIYPLLTKGKLGDQQMAWFKKHLIDPYARAKHDISTARINLMDDFKALKKTLDVPAELRKTNETGFTNEQAVRVYVWTAMGYDIPGLSKTDLKELTDFIEANPTLQTFAEQLLVINKNNDYTKPGKDWLAGTITTDLLDGLNTLYRAEALKEWQENADLIFSEKNLNKLEAIYGPKYREAMENILARMKSGKNRLASGNRLSNRVLDYINNSTGVIMFFNMRSAVLQSISMTNFINWSFNNPYQAGKAFANQSQYWKDFMFLMNSNYLRDRRKGQKLDISEAEIANAAATATNKARAAISYILSKGYLPTQMMDSFAIASGGATYYRNRINNLIKQGLDVKEAEAQAYTEFIEKSEESQQSSDPSKISAQQSSDLGRLTLTFGVTPMQYGRLTKKAYLDLINGRGDAKENISKIVYYTFIQNMIFNALQQAVFAIGFGDGDDEKKEEKLYDTANGMADSILRGLGIGGVAVSVVKNFLLDIYERAGRSRPEYVDSIWKLTQFSPPISSKISRLRQAAWYFDSKKRRKEMIDKGFSIDNNAYKAAAKVIAATTNVPLDRMLLKIENVQAALSEEADWWQSMAMLLGWPKWMIMPEEKKTSKPKKKTSKPKTPFTKTKKKSNPFAKSKRKSNPFR
tara:strand:- start:1811 stop:11311 length:9501 start_codon:yes stop_codon:yes gene_type:complete